MLFSFKYAAMLKLPWWLLLVCSLMMACNNNKKEKKADTTEPSSESIMTWFKEAKLPYQLSDTGLLKNKDTTALPSNTVANLIPDSIITTYFGRKATVKYTSLAKFTQKENETFLVVKAEALHKKAAFLLAFDPESNFLASYPFLLPDDNANTSQVSSIDKNLTITKTTVQREGQNIIGEGKEVVAYDASGTGFSIVMVDALNDNPDELANPIDTFPKTNKLAGDYLLNKKNIVSVRDGRQANHLLVYIHTENKAGDCIGQMKGEFLMTSSTSATYRQGGDPCVLNIRFKGNTVSISEESGCGNYRGLDCQLTGTFTRKKPQPVKPETKKPKG